MSARPHRDEPLQVGVAGFSHIEGAERAYADARDRDPGAPWMSDAAFVELHRDGRIVIRGSVLGHYVDVDGEGLVLGSGAGRCAAVGNLKSGEIVEIFYTGSAFYTGSKDDAVRKDDGAPKTALNEGVGRAIYKMDAAGLLGFEIEKGKAITKIVVYTNALIDARHPSVRVIGENNPYARLPKGAILPLESSRQFDQGLIGSSVGLADPTTIPWSVSVLPENK
jgi:hypothetical protein